MNKKLIFFLKLLLSSIILYLLIKGIDINQSIKTLLRINPIVFISMVIIYLFGQELSAWKWSIISDRLGFNYKLSQYSAYYFIGMFFNLFLPTGVGGDLTKAYYLCKNKPKCSKTDGIFSVFSDRLTGIMVLILICFVGLFFKSAQYLNLYVKVFIVFAFTAMLLFSFLFPKISKIKYLMKYTFIKKFSNCIDKVWTKSLIKVFIISFVFHIFMLIIHFCIGRTMGLNIPVSYYLIVYPITAIVSILPISVNGIGIRELAYIYLLNIVSVNPSQSLVFSFCWFTIALISSLFGAVFYVRNEH